VEGEGWFDLLMQLRSDLMHGDRRCLYLGWLRAVQEGMVGDDDPEPPVPPGLAALNAPLRNLAEFLDIDPDLIDAAAEESAEEVDYSLSKRGIRDWVAELPLKDKNAILVGLIEGNNPHIAAELRQRALCEIRAKETATSCPRSAELRNSGQLSARAKTVGEEQRKQEAERKAKEAAERERERAEAHVKRVESLVGRESELWATVDQLIATRQPKEYDRAVSLLQDLRDLAVRAGTSSAFSQHMSALYRRHKRKPSLVARFEKAMLLPLEETP
jgi:hypothetical protein